jgi:hypothetical protein
VIAAFSTDDKEFLVREWVGVFEAFGFYMLKRLV